MKNSLETRLGLFFALALIAVLPVLGLIPFTFQSISTVADHYVYLSMFGVGLVVTVIIDRSDALWLRVLAIALIAALSLRAFEQAGHWRNSETLFTHALEVNPGSAMSLTNLAVDRAQHGDRTAALHLLEQAVVADPDYGFARVDFAQLLVRAGRLDEAAEQYRELLRIYKSQRNADPQLAAKAEAAYEALIARARAAGSATTTRWQDHP